jgi:predicted nucleic-acid-binding Zn-ribbon protein
MKIRLYCPWCGNFDDYELNKVISTNKFSKGKSNVSSQILCSKCGRHVKQKQD